MVRVAFVTPEGERREVVSAGEATLMHLAVREDVPGLPAECGGQLACATCMVVVAPEWRDRVGPPGEDERDMIEDALGEVPEGMRLCCQVPLRAELDGLEVRVPSQPGY
ncbi:2Fe-2S iron-sulfur cluster-binding protein [Siccirubricoccus sp. KC 17139]|uniref:2Fe-2S iron-sulfur cluster-binding protein n=1 Tax=Siccirubricoccus soli TaxID=2899147 RepID=A0ABT1D125_9PROT|nr:2Fe-2S iron-sulfur cluster-binding protein [Siccirubricoccus soli]MCO6415611.1 2Fe-2S iron-sulfur cluster-binding protein [Siccirubricoccus soli]MCP2681743.1 2Fe-2S iron-sulfur cluster-binding protein [Siccirubricoccus soli]